MKSLLILTGVLTASGALMVPATAATCSATSMPPNPAGIQVAGLFRVLDIAEDVDDLIDGDIGKIDPIQNVTRDIEDAFDDVGDEIEDFGDDAQDAVRDINRRIDRVSDDVNDWFD
jgi:hypothetical protein